MTRRIITEDACDTEFSPLNQTILSLDSPVVTATDPHHIWTEVDTQKLVGKE